MIEQDFEQRFETAMKRLEVRFEQPIDLQAALFLIGVNELGQGPRKLNKDKKLDVMHIAVCCLLEPYGYYSFDGLDKQGWPHYTLNERIPMLSGKEQEQMMKEAIIKYIDYQGI